MNGSSTIRGLMNSSQFLEQWKQAKMQWLQDPNHSSVDYVNNISCEASRHFRNKNKEYL